MKNAISTEIVTLRLPNALVERIDKIILEEETYSNRPDFIIAAIRSYLNDSIFTYLVERELDMGEPVVSRERLEYDLEQRIISITLHEEMYNEIEGKPVQILLRIPIGIRKRWETIKKILPIKNFQDFIRFSIIPFISEDEQLNDQLKMMMEKHPRRSSLW